MINLTEEEKKYILKNRISRIEKDGLVYFIKPNENGEFIELVCKILADKVGINCVNYEPIEINDYLYYISEDINNNSNYVPASVVCFDSDSLYDTWISLEDLPKEEKRLEKLQNYHVFIDGLSPQEIQTIMNKLTRIFIFDLFILNCDRHDDNWGLTFKKRKEIPSVFEDVIILDNETSFNVYGTALKNSFLDEKIDHFGFNHSILELNLQNLDNFLKTSSPEFVDMFKEMFEILTPGLVIETFNQIEKQYGVVIKEKHKYIDLYLENYNMMNDLVSSRGLA